MILCFCACACACLCVCLSVSSFPAGEFKTKTIDLVVSSIQASILLLLNDGEGMEIKELQKHTGLDADQMKRLLDDFDLFV